MYSVKTWSLLHMNDNPEGENGELAERSELDWWDGNNFRNILSRELEN